MSRVLMAGFLHETNTFSQTPASWDNFVNGEGFPRMHRNDELFDLKHVNIPLGGFINDAAEDWELLPTIWCAASPSGKVAADTFESIAALIIDACEHHVPDAVYLDLHGAMVSDDYQDADGELIQRVRHAVGSQVPIVVSLDLHANVSDLMAETADAMVAYRTYPHVDMADTGRTCAKVLRQILDGQIMIHSIEKLDFLIPTISGSTMEGPAKEIYELLAELPNDDATVSIAMAFPATDVLDCRPTVFGYGVDQDRLRHHVTKLARELKNREAAFAIDALPAAEAVQLAKQRVQVGVRPVLLADTQDNPGAGGNATTMGLLRELLKHNIPHSSCAAIHDNDVVAAALQAGEGSAINVAFPGSGINGDYPLEETFEVEGITDGKIVFDGPMMHGNQLSVGPSVVLRNRNVRVVVNSQKAQIMDRNQFRAAGIVPEDQNVLVVKSSVHFRGDFSGLAEDIIVALSPGPFPANPEELPWRHLADGVRLSPLGPEFHRQS